MKRLVVPLLITASIGLSACNNVPDYREPVVQPTTTSIVSTTPTPIPTNIISTTTPMPTQIIEPSENYSEYKDAKELLTINLKEGPKGEVTAKGDEVSVHYSGFLTDGTLFDSSRSRNEPFSFPLGEGYVIKGWDEGFMNKKVGDKFTLVIPPTKGYGDRDMGTIPPKSVLIFEVEIMGITKQ